jgi:MYXO-CTERM domain-containing protein
VLNVFDANIQSTSGFFHNSINGGGQSALPFTAAETAISDFPEADSFVTIGLETGDDNETLLTFGFDEDAFINSNNLGENGGWLNLNPLNDAGLAGAEGLVLLAVFTPTNDAFGNPGIVSGTLTVGYHVEEGKSPQFGTGSLVTPAPGSLALVGLAALFHSRSRRRRQPIS